MATFQVSDSFLLVESVKKRDSSLTSSNGPPADNGGNIATPLCEQVPLQREAKKGHEAKRRSKFKTRCCVKSKAALLILLWTSLVFLALTTVLDQNIYLSIGRLMLQQKSNSVILSIKVIPPAVYTFFAIVYLFYPLAGCLADIKCGRYKTVTSSLWLIAGSGLVLIVSVMILLWAVTHQAKLELEIFFGVVSLFSLMLLYPGYIAFDANVIQFGMDQLHDSPSEDSVIFIHWFVFSSSLGVALTRVPSSWITAECWDSYLGFTFLALIIILLLGVSLCLARCKRRWFLVDTGSRNPYKLVYRVIKFAAQHKVPIRRSAFTYCEDELPSRMDLGKDKYGGPFTTEQVEDVKAFLGILSILLTLGPTFTVNTSVNNLLNTVSHHFTNRVNHSCTPTNYLIESFEHGSLSSMFILILIPTYICLLRPFIGRYVPGMLRRIGLGMILMVISLMCTLLIDTMGHVKESHKVCFRKVDTRLEPAVHRFDPTTAYNIIPSLLNGVGYTLLYIGSYEFMCAQSPYAMKGLLIGTFYAIKGVFQLIGALVIFTPFSMYRLKTDLPSCGFVYYLVNIVVAVSGLVAYTWVARRYKYRERDEPDNIYRYAEDYYDRDGDDSYHNNYY